MSFSFDNDHPQTTQAARDDGLYEARMIFVGPASSSVLKVAQRSSPSDPRVPVWLPPVGQYPSPVGDHRPRHRGRETPATDTHYYCSPGWGHVSLVSHIRIDRKKGKQRRRQSP